MRALHVYRLGRVEYEDGLLLQKLFLEARRQGLVPDTLLLLEHPPVLTLGRAAKDGNILAPPALLEQLGVEVHHTDRGGDVTYHGPGQIVGYPILNLAPDRQDVRKYVRCVEEGLIRALSRFGIAAGRISEWPGVWLGAKGDPDARKIGAIGVHISRWLTTHGFALNVRPDLRHFQLIVPCGIQEAGVTSMAMELGTKAPSVEAVEDALARAYGEVFEAEVTFQPERLRTVSVTVVDAQGQVLALRRTEARGGFWQTVTGRIEAGESALQAAGREVKEETGVALEVRPLDYVHAFALGDELPPRLVEETAFIARWPQGATLQRSPEHQEHRWISAQQAQTLLPFAGLKKAARMAAAGPGQ
ncbi:MAG: lipoyl(octanoyl) transferase LipB [Myxococcota bacterium]|nr:lipoyl(octanoyl) transferase LipB [Myxococcota bacterium]